MNCGIGDCSLGSIIIMAAGGNGGEDGPGLGGSTSSGSGNPGASGADGQGGGGGAVNSGGANGGSGGGAGGGIVFRNALSGGGAGGSDGGGNGGSGGNGMGGGGGGGSSSSAGSGGASGQTGAAGGNTTSASSFNSGSNPQGTPGGTGGASATARLSSPAWGPCRSNWSVLSAHPSGNSPTAVEHRHRKNNHGFEIERSIDNLQWTTLGFVAGNGTSTEQHDYDFSDDRPHAGVNFYRLKQMDTDGGYEYSPMVVADIRSTAQFDVFPNPAVSGALTFRAVSSISGDATLRIFDWMGHQVYAETIALPEGTLVYPVSLSTFPKGTYTARLQMPDGTALHKKIVLQ
ncbi:MAG: T9SS type A sorting domain-containing protein [Lewinellaceae bacterium]|nr:T9SS type A sorting domain-containing protein [Lewinellaceae bacterium]